MLRPQEPWTTTKTLSNASAPHARPAGRSNEKKNSFSICGHPAILERRSGRDAKVKAKTDDPLKDDAGPYRSSGRTPKGQFNQRSCPIVARFLSKILQRRRHQLHRNHQTTKIWTNLCHWNPFSGSKFRTSKSTKRGTPSLRSVSEDHSASFRVEDPSSLNLPSFDGSQNDGNVNCHDHD